MRLADCRHLLPGAAALGAARLVALLGLTAGAQEPKPQVEPAPLSGTVELQLLGVNDFHGHLEPPEPGAGGGAWLNRAAGSHPERTIRVHAGDMVGASPLISSHFKDEPTIEATNLMGFDVGTPGNHEFDEGGAEALRLVRRARYPYVAAKSRHPRGPRVHSAPVPDHRALRSEGWLHRGHHQGHSPRQMDDAVDVVIASHTHSRLDLQVDGKLVVQAFSYGLAFDQVRITVDRASGQLVAGSWRRFARSTRACGPIPDLDALVKDAARSCGAACRSRRRSRAP